MAKENPRYEHTVWPDWEYREFPMMVYPGAADPLVAEYITEGPRKGQPIAGVIVKDAAEADEVLGIDRTDGAAAAPAPKPEAPRYSPKKKIVPTDSPGVSRVSTVADEHAELDAEAERLGIPKFDKSWSPARKQDAIDTFKAAEAEKAVV